MSAGQSVIIRCDSCGTKNRIPMSKAGMKPVCGKCKAPLDLSQIGADRPVNVTDASFESEVIKSPLPVLLDCWAPWCGPCRMVAPVLEELAGQWQGRIKVAKLNTDENPTVAARYQIRSIPTLLVFHQGQLRDTMVGALPKAEIERRMASFL
jgi:thioredoxin 2